MSCLTVLDAIPHALMGMGTVVKGANHTPKRYDAVESCGFLVQKAANYLSLMWFSGVILGSLWARGHG